MKIDQYMDILHLVEKMKNNTRHSWTSSGRKESVAEHSYRLTIMAYFLKDRFPDADIDKVIRMCMFHDMGEAFTGDIPAFEKTQEHENKEEEVLSEWVTQLPEPFKSELTDLYQEMNALETEEAKIYKALDRMEAVIQHNEADLSTWLPLEYDLQLTYGTKEVQFSEVMQELKNKAIQDSRKKMNCGHCKIPTE